MLRVNGASIITNLTHKTKIEFKGECAERAGSGVT